MLIKRGPGAGRKSSQSHDDGSSSQARGLTDTSRDRHRDPSNQDWPGNEQQQQHGISRSRTTAGHNRADDRPADGQPFLSRQDPCAARIAFHAGLEEPSSGSSPATCCRGASRAARASATCTLRPSPAPAGGEPGSVLNIPLSPPTARRASRPRPGKSPASCAGPARSSPTATKAATSTSTPN